MKAPRNAIEQTEFMRNLLAFLLVGAFISVLPVLTFFIIPAENKEIVTYMVGQLSGMATMALGFYFVNKVGQDALDAARTENTGKMAEAVTSALKSGDKDKAVEAAVDQVVEAADGAASDIKGE
jgi:uncharacterized membrane-anchored protein